MSARRKAFLAFSTELTGYDEADLEGTGLVDDYQALVERQAGPEVTAQLYATLRRVLRHRPGPARDEAMRLDILASPILWGLSSALIVLPSAGVAVCPIDDHLDPPGQPVPEPDPRARLVVAVRGVGEHVERRVPTARVLRDAPGEVPGEVLVAEAEEQGHVMHGKGSGSGRRAKG